MAINTMSSYNKEIVQFNADLSTMKVDTTNKRAIINIGGILSQLLQIHLLNRHLLRDKLITQSTLEQAIDKIRTLPTATTLPHQGYEIYIPPGVLTLASAALLLICIKTSIKLWSRFTKSTPKGEKAKLYVKIFDAKHTSLIYLTDIPLDVKIKFNEIPIMERFSITYKRLWPTIDIKWQQKLSFTFDNQVQQIELPTSIKISIMESEKLNAINASEFMTFYALLYVPNESNVYRNLEHINERLCRPSRT